MTKYDENVSGFELKKVNSGISSVTFYMDSSEDVPYPFYINFWGEYDSDEFEMNEWYRNNKFIKEVCKLLARKDSNISVYLEDESTEFNSKTVKDFL